MNRYFSVFQNGQESEIYIFGDIASYPVLESDVSAFSLAQQISEINADVLHVHINSYGGEVSEGWAIYNALRKHPAHVITHADGFVASAALYPFMAGDEREASNLSAFFFHRVMTGAFGNADDLRAAADEAEQLNRIGLAAFENAGVNVQEIEMMEKAETWLDASQALTLGVATRVVKDAVPQIAQSAKRAVMQRVLCAPAPADPKDQNHIIKLFETI